MVLPEFQVWYRLPKKQKIEVKIVEAQDRFDVHKQIVALDPNVTVGLIARIDEPEFEANRDFLQALTKLADAAGNLSVAVNEVLRTWPQSTAIPGEMKELMGRIEKWIDAQPQQGSDTLKRRLGINWDELPLTLTVQEVAEVLRIGRQQVYELCHGYMYDFPYVKVGERRFVIPREALRVWFENACKEGTFLTQRPNKKK